MNRDGSGVAAPRWRSDGDSAAEGGLHRYRLVVLGTGVSDVVESVGGFLCDRARAGWDVSVLLARPCDMRPLAVLGVAAQELDTDVTAVLRGLSGAAAIAVGADMLTDDVLVRDDVARVVAEGLTEVIVWGRPGSGGFGDRLEPAAHPLSVAATAFKRHALVAAGRCEVSAEGVAPDEVLFRLHERGGRRLHSV